mgnify:CR=1 FL=1
MDKRNVVIIGSGPAGYTAAVYASRACLEPLLFEGFFSGPAGGQLMTTTDVENYPGFPQGIMGPDLMIACREQAVRFGTEMVTEDVVSFDASKRPFIVRGKSREIEARAVIIATGASAKRLDIPGARDGELWQKGVSACAVCDGAMPIFRGQELYVVGGGDTAVEEALFLTKYASHVYVVHRRDTLRASKVMGDRLLAHPSVTLIWNSEVAAVLGEQQVERVRIRNRDGQEEERPAGGLFFAIGHTPNTSFLSGVPLYETGYIKVEPGTARTSIEGLFAAGDVADHVYRQAVTAAGTGCMAAIEAERYIAGGA